MRISDWSSDVYSSDLIDQGFARRRDRRGHRLRHRRFDLDACGLFDLGELRFRADAGFEQLRADARHRPGFLAGLQLILRCIEVVADAGVRTEAIRRGFDEDRDRKSTRLNYST